MRARASLLFLVSLLVAGLAALAPLGGRSGGLEVPPPPSAEQLLQGTWVAVRADQGWVVTEQEDPPAGLWRNPYELPEEWKMPKRWDVLSKSREPWETLTFAGGRYTTRCDGRVCGFGDFTVDDGAGRPILRTRGCTINYFIHPESMSVFTSDVGPEHRMLVAIRPGRLKMCVSQNPDQLPAELRAIEDETYVVTFARLPGPGLTTVPERPVSR
ncbi:hypothetical protein [Zavarzinella formosa]|uniref:hypothetical protein n=1 Tax=Zavarzinella formosa TaxID=360055 RepID=UPI0003199BB0|nr:hypothetical protein [Zavarzinella formosa]